MNFGILALAFLFSLNAHATGPAGGAIQGTLLAPGGTPVTSSNVNFKIQVMDKNAACVLYEETHTGVDLSATNGDFSFDLGYGGVRTNNVDGSAVLKANVFRNDVNIAPGQPWCAPGIVFASGDPRLIRVQFDVGGGFVTLTPDMRLQGSVYSSVAETVQGKTPTDFVQVKNDGATVSLSQSNLENAFSFTNYPKLMALINGTSTQYLTTAPSAPLNLNNQPISNLADPTAPQDAVTKIYADTYVAGKQIDLQNVGAGSGGGKVLVWDQAQNKWVAQTITAMGTAGGDLAGTYPDPTIANNAVTSAKINDGTIATADLADAAVSPVKLVSGAAAVNRMFLSDGITGTSFAEKTCANDEVLKYSIATGWTCTAVSAISPVPQVEGRTGNVDIDLADIQSAGTAAARNVGTGVGDVVTIQAGGKLPAVDGSDLTNVNAVKLQGRDVANAGPNAGDVLTWNNTTSKWEPVAPGVFGTGDLNNGGNNGAVVVGSNDNKLSLEANNATAMTILANGNVGIGTTAPGRLLDVNGPVRVAPAALPGTPAAGDIAIDSGDANKLKFHNGTSWVTVGSGTGTGDFMKDGSVAMTGNFRLGNNWFSNDGDPEGIRVATDGKVGIGTTSPQSELDVNGDVALNRIVTHDGTTTGTITGGYWWMDPRASVAQMGDAIVLEAGAPNAAATDEAGGPLVLQSGKARGNRGSEIEFWTAVKGAPGNGLNNQAIRMKIDESGNVGIGTSSPGQLLHVNGAMRLQPAALPGTPGAGDVAIDSGDANKLKWYNGSGWQVVGTSSATGDLNNGGNNGAVVVGSNDNKLSLEANNATAMTILANGNVGIGTTSPAHKFHVEGPFVSTGEWGNGDTLNVSGQGTRMFFYPRKAAFRGGYADGTEWDDANIGEGSFAFGNEVAATGDLSVAMGSMTTASGVSSVAIGKFASATGANAVALAQGQAVGDLSTAFDSSEADGFYSVAMGSSTASGDRSFSFGANASANGTHSVAIGRETIADSFNSVAVGSFNVGGGNATAWVASDPLFVVGNGTSAGARSNALTILKNGNLGVGTTSPAALLHVNGPVRVQPAALPGAPGAGDIAIDSGDANKLKWYNGSGWQTVGTGGGTGDINNGGNTFGAAATIGTNDGFALNFETGGTTKMTIDPNGSIGIGGAVTPDGRVAVTNATSSNVDGGYYVQNNVDAAGGGMVVGYYADTITSANSANWLYDLYGQMNIDNAASEAYGSNHYINVVSGGTLDAAKGFNTAVASFGTGVITDARGVNIEQVKGVDAYGVRIEGITGSNSAYGIYQSQAAVPNFFNGSVGIGTTSPSMALDIGDGNSNKALRINGAGSGAAGGAQLVIANGASGNVMTLGNYSAITGGAYNNLATIYVPNSNLSIPLGNVGIGTTSPGRLLHVNGAMRVEPAALPGTPSAGDLAIDSGDANKLKFHNGTSWVTVGAGGGTGDFMKDGSVAMTGNLKLGNNWLSNDGDPEGIRIDTSGNIGIGTSAPGSPLSVESTYTGTAFNVAQTQYRTLNPSANMGAQSAGIMNTISDQASRTNNLGNVLGQMNFIFLEGTGSSGWVAGNYSSVQNGGNANIGSIEGYYTELYNEEGTNNEMVGFDGYLEGYGTSATTNMIGARIEMRQNGSATVQNRYALKIVSPTGTATNDYGIYQAGTQKNYFAGNIGAGISAPARALHVNGAARIEPAALPGTPGAGDVAIDSGDANKLKFHNGTSWVTVGSGTGTGDFMKDGSVAMTGNFKLGNNWLSNDGDPEGIRIDASGNIGIGVTSPGAPLEVYKSFTTLPTTTGGAWAQAVTMDLNPSADQTLGNWNDPRSYAFGSFANIPASNTHKLNYVTGGALTAVNSGTGDVQFLLGADLWAQNDQGNITGRLMGVTVGAMTSNGSVESMIGEKNWTRATGGTVNYQYGNLIEVEQSGSGVVNNRYGLYMSAAGTATNDFGLYQATSTQKNYFAGNVGIGTTNPGRMLHVNGAARLEPAALPGTPAAGDIAIDSGDANKLKFHNGTSWVTVGSGTGTGDFMKDGSVAMTGTFKLGNNWLSNDGGAEGIRIDTAGNVGIGTSSIDFRLHLVDGTEEMAFSPGNGGLFGAAGSNPAMSMTRKDLPTSGSVVSRIWTGKYLSNALSGSVTSEIVFRATENWSNAPVRGGTRIDFTTTANSGAGGGTAMTINHDGNVGIGTTAPGRLLHVNGPVRLEPAALPGSPAAGDVAIDSGDANKLKFHNGTSWITVGTGNGNGNGDFMKDGSIAMTGNFKLGNNWLSNDGDPEGIAVDTAGKVGIGTTSPGQKLSVNGAIESISGGFKFPDGTTQTTAAPTPASSPSFFVHKNGSVQGVTTNTWTPITWSTESFDINGNFASNKFTPTVPGRYQINLNASCSDATGFCSVIIAKNNATCSGGYISQGYNDSAGGKVATTSAVVDMNGTTDYVIACVNNNGGVTVDGQTFMTNFSGGLMSGGGSGGGNDNLGNHVATQNLQLGAYWLSGDGGNEGLQIDANGNVGIGTSAPGSALDVKGTLRLSGATSGYVGFAPAAAAGSTIYTLPSADGTSGQVLTTNGAGALNWVSPSLSYSYTNTGGTGDRSASITVTTSASLFAAGSSGPLSNLVDGAFATNNTDSKFFTSGGAVSGAWLKFNFGASKIIDQVKFYQSNSATHGSWKWQGSNNDSTWTDLTSSFTLGGSATQTISLTNSAGYQYYRMLGISGNTDNVPWIEEFEFSIGSSSLWLANGNDVYYSGGSVGIGTSSPAALFHVAGTITSNASGLDQMRNIVTFNPSSAPAANHYVNSLNSEIHTAGSSSLANAELSGSSGYVSHETAQTLKRGWGVWGGTFNSSTGTIDFAVGTEGNVQNASTGTITNAHALMAYIDSTSTGTIANAYGVYSMINRASGTITNGYGVNIGTINATNKWGVYQTDPAARNFFAGNIGIGTMTSPQFAIHAAAPDQDTQIMVENSSSTAARYPRVAAVNYSNNFANSFPVLQVQTYRGNNIAPAAVQSGDILGAINMVGGNGSSYNTSWLPAMYAKASENFTTAANGTELHFQTIPNGATGPQERMFIANGGNVGIGTTNPGRLLHVNGVARLEPAALPGSPAAGDIAIDSGDANKLKFHNGSSWVTVGSGGTGTPAGSNKQIQFNNSGAFGASSYLNWDESTRSLGINTASPSYFIDVRAAVNTAAMNVEGTGLVGNAYMRVASPVAVATLNANGVNVGSATDADRQSGSLLNATGAGGLSLAASNTTSGEIRFYTDGATATEQRMTIVNGGNVGIGTTNPGQKLSVNGTIESISGGIKFPDGTVQTTAATALTSQTAWVKIYSQEVTTAATSVTISGLNGDADVVYKLAARIVQGSSGTSQIYTMRFNGDSGSNYGKLNIYADGASVATSVGSNQTSIWVAETDGLGRLTQFDSTIYAKSGRTRTTLSTAMSMVNGETISEVVYHGASWSNTASNITSLTIQGTSANDIGVGSIIEVWAQRPVGGTGDQWTVNGSDIYRASGNIGVGTTSPSNQLHLRDPGNQATPTSVPPAWVQGYIERYYIAGSAAGFAIQGGDKASGGNANLYLGNADEYDSTSIKGAAGKLSFFTRNAGAAASEVVTVKPDGNVGIGTTNPGQKLEVAGNIKMTGAGTGITFNDGTTQTTAATPQMQMQVFTASGTFTTPAGTTTATRYKFTVVGGGGAGGGSTGSATWAGGGGGAGAVAIYQASGVAAGTAVAVTVGAAGVGNASANGGNGGSSTVVFNGTTVTGGGGSGGQSGTGGGTGGTGGNATNGTLNIGGGTGERSNNEGSGSGGSNGYGFGGPGNFTGAGIAARGYGGGGGGGYFAAGANGTAGVVIVEWNQ